MKKTSSVLVAITAGAFLLFGYVAVHVVNAPKAQDTSSNSGTGTSAVTAVFLRDSDEFAAMCQSMSGRVSSKNASHTIKCLGESIDLTDTVESELFALSQRHGKNFVLGAIPVAGTGAVSATDSWVNASGGPESAFDSYEPMPELVASTVNYNTGTTEFADPWKAATFTDKNGELTMLYQYCDIVGAQIEGVKKAGLSWKDAYDAFQYYGARMNGLTVVSWEEIDTEHESANHSAFSFRKASREACFVTFMKESMDCMNPALNFCHVTFEIHDSIAEGFGKWMKDVFDEKKRVMDEERRKEAYGEEINDAIREFDFHKVK